MGFRANHSSMAFTPERILEKISEYDIFKRYCTNFRKIDVPFVSDIRNDKSPSCKIGFPKGSSSLFYKDFSTGDSYNCFSYLRAKWPHLNMYEVLVVIDRDFNLNLRAINVSKQEMAITLEDKSKRDTRGKKQFRLKKSGSVIIPTFREWSAADKLYWSRYNITPKELEMFGVRPISSYTGTRTHICGSTLTYHYRIQSSSKIYAPLADKAEKWRSNTTASNIQGYEMLPPKGETLIITSSLKDVIVLYKCGYPAIALVSETNMPSELLCVNLSRRFNNVAVLLDNDYESPNNPGQKSALKMQGILYAATGRYSTNIIIPEKYQSTDPSDLVEEHDYRLLRSLLKSSLDGKDQEDAEAPF